MAAASIEIVINLKRYSFFNRIKRFPKVLKKHYVAFRNDGLSFFESVYASWLFASLLFRIK